MTHSSKRRLYLNFSPLFLLFVNTMSFLPAYAKVKKPLSQRYYEPAFKNLMARFEKSVPVLERQKVQRAVKAMSHDLIEFEQAFNAKPFPTSRDSAMSNLIVEYAIFKRSVYDMLCKNKSLTPELVAKLQDHFKIFRRKVIDLEKTDPSISYVTQPLLSFCSSCVNKLCVSQNVPRFQKIMSTVRRAWNYSKMKLLIGAPLALMLYAVVAPQSSSQSDGKPDDEHERWVSTTDINRNAVDDLDLVDFGPMEQSLVEQGHEVLVSARRFLAEVPEKLSAHGVDIHGSIFLQKLFATQVLESMCLLVQSALNKPPCIPLEERHGFLDCSSRNLKTMHNCLLRFFEHYCDLLETEDSQVLHDCVKSADKVVGKLFTNKQENPSMAEKFHAELAFVAENFKSLHGAQSLLGDLQVELSMAPKELLETYLSEREHLHRVRELVTSVNGKDLEYLYINILRDLPDGEKLTAEYLKEKLNSLLCAPEALHRILQCQKRRKAILKGITKLAKAHPIHITELDKAQLEEAEVVRCAICLDDYEPESKVDLLSCCPGYGGKVYVNHLCKSCSDSVKECPFCRNDKKVGFSTRHKNFFAFHLGQRLLAQRATAND